MADTVKYTKGDAVKFINPKSKLISILKDDGWAEEGGKTKRTGRPKKVNDDDSKAANK